MSLPAGTESGVPVLVTAISPDPLVVVVVAAVLLAGVGSGVGDEALAVLVIVVPAAVPGLTRTTRVIAAGVPVERLPVVHETLPVPPTAGDVQVQPLGAVTERNVVLVGTASVSVTLAALLGPLLVTPMV